MPETLTPEAIQETPLEKGNRISGEIIRAVTEFRNGFKCQKCGKCCREGVGVALWPHEFRRLQKLEKHLIRHITFINDWYALKMPCVFYNTRSKKCKIYDHRPIACRLYPLGVRNDATTRVSNNCTVIKSREGS